MFFWHLKASNKGAKETWCILPGGSFHRSLLHHPTAAWVSHPGGNLRQKLNKMSAVLVRKIALKKKVALREGHIRIENGPCAVHKCARQEKSVNGYVQL